MTPAERGDIAIIPVTFWTTFLVAESTNRTEYHVTIVTSITRDGVVKSVRTVDSDMPIPVSRFYPGGRRGSITLASKDKVDVEKVIEAVCAHTWPGHPEQVKAYDSWDEVRDMVRSFAK